MVAIFLDEGIRDLYEHKEAKRDERMKAGEQGHNMAVQVLAMVPPWAWELVGPSLTEGTQCFHGDMNSQSY